MKYSEEFKQKILWAFEGNENISQVLEDGNPLNLKQCIDDAIYGRYGGVSAQAIVDACESQNYQELYEKAKKQLALMSLSYELWDMLRKERLEQRQSEQNHNGMHKK